MIIIIFAFLFSTGRGAAVLLERGLEAQTQRANLPQRLRLSEGLQVAGPAEFADSAEGDVTKTQHTQCPTPRSLLSQTDHGHCREAEGGRSNSVDTEYVRRSDHYH